jgi:hypothetical protein
VYSFGIRDDWTFDVAMRDAGCEVHSFDPTIGTPRRCRWGSDLSPHGCHPSGIDFHPIGLGAVDGERLQVDEDSAKHGGAGELKSLSTIRKELGHQDRELTVLKFDIEGSEWAILKQIAANSEVSGNVAQILTEIHYWGAGCDKAQQVWYERRRKHQLDEANVRTSCDFLACHHRIVALPMTGLHQFLCDVRSRRTSGTTYAATSPQQWQKWRGECQYFTFPSWLWSVVPQSNSSSRSYHTTIQNLATAGYVFSHINVNAWSTIMQGLVANETGTQITSVKDEDVQCCYEVIITNVGHWSM